jgi:multiple sugar transport system substrate-binding protein
MKTRRVTALFLALGMSSVLVAGCGSTASKSSPGTTGTAAKAAAGTTAKAAGTTAKAAASAAGTKKADSKKPVTVRLWMGIPPEAGPQAVIDAFNAAYKDKGIQAEYERYVNDDQGNLKLETSLMSGSDIDVFATYGNYRTVKRAQAGMAMDLTKYMERDKFDYVGLCGDNATKCYVDGKPYSFYVGMMRGSLLVNKDMFEKAGIAIPTEWTFDEFREACKKLTHGEGTDKVYGMFWNSPQNMGEYMSYLAQLTLGGDWIYNADGKTARLNDPVTVAAMQLVVDTMKDGTAPTHIDSVTQKLTQESVFLTGHCAMIIGNWASRSVKDTKQYPHDFVTAYVPYPVISKDQDKYTFGGFGDELSINAKTEHPDEAWEFLKWYTTEGAKYMAVGGRFGLSKSINVDEEIALFMKGAEKLIDQDSLKKVVFTDHGKPVTIPTISTKGPEIYKALNEELEAAMNGKKTVQQALDDANKRANDFLSKP